MIFCFAKCLVTLFLNMDMGMFFFHNPEWSMRFLDLWWNQTSFIIPFSHCKSGDNDALKGLVKSMPKDEKKKHVHIPCMQCVFNSNMWSPSWKCSHHLLTLSKIVWRGKKASIFQGFSILFIIYALEMKLNLQDASFCLLIQYIFVC